MEPDGSYVVDPERGPRQAVASDVWPVVSGKCLLDMERDLQGQAGPSPEMKAAIAAFFASRK